MGFKCGFVGLPNVGKSTLFNALTLAGVAASNYPFCTIDPHVGDVSVNDPRLFAISELVQPKQTIPTRTQFVDIAGLVAGASKGEGLGNQFLSHIREVQAIAHVVRCHQNRDVIHVTGQVDPVSDVEIIETELCLADLECVERAIQKCEKKCRSGDKEAKAALVHWQTMAALLSEGRSLRSADLDEEAISLAAMNQLITIKPMFYIANVDELAELEEHQTYQALFAYCQENKAICVPICATIEAELAQLSQEDQKDFLSEMGLSEPGLHRVVRVGYDLLNLQTFFTAGEKEVRAWTVQQGAMAPDAAGVIHTDFIKGFIRAEVIAYHDYIAHKGESGAKEAGLWRLEGKDYVVQDGDVIFFRTST